jgi:hypothetical protein
LHQPPKPTLQAVRGNTTSPDPDDDSEKLDELDLALVKSLVSYFEKMPGKIIHYYRDRHASREEAEIVGNYYLSTASRLKDVNNQQDLKEIIEFIEKLKEKVSRYQHESYKYRWSTGLEKEVLAKLRKIGSKTANPEATSSISPSSPNPVNASRTTSVLQNFEFEVVTLKAVQQYGFLGSNSMVVTNKSRKQAQFFTENLLGSVTLEMVLIPGGVFLMGSPPHEEGRSDREGPQHRVSTDKFFMSKYPIM